MIIFSDALYNQDKIAGVYVIYSGDGVPLYCGQSCNIMERLGVHRKWVSDSYYAEIILLEPNKHLRMEFEGLYHDVCGYTLLSKKYNGRDTPCKFNGMEFDSKTDMYNHVSDIGGISTTTVEKYIRKYNCKTLLDILTLGNNEQQSRIDAVSASNARRVGKKLNMKPKICPHCGAEGKGGNMTRYHFNNCKDSS